MMKGKQIYLTHQEIKALLLTLEDFEEVASENLYAHRLKYGLGTAWGKLTTAAGITNKNGEKTY